MCRSEGRSARPILVWLAAAGTPVLLLATSCGGGKVVPAFDPNAPASTSPSTASLPGEAGGPNGTQSNRTGTTSGTGTNPSSTPSGSLIAPDSPAPSDVLFALDSSKNHSISRFIYGLNQTTTGSDWGSSPPPATLARLGGNRLSAYNWWNSYSNSGNDLNYVNDQYLSQDTTPGAAARDEVNRAHASGSGTLLTVPLLGYVAADANGPVPIPTALSTIAPATPDLSRFVISAPRDPSGATAAPTAASSGIYQDDFVKWVDTTWPGVMADSTAPIMFSLDNEPDLWGDTHLEVRGLTSTGLETMTGNQELLQKTVDYASAIKRVNPQATVFGGVFSGWYGLVTLGSGQVPSGYQYYSDYFLDGLAQADAQQGRRLVDVLDLHWYPEAQGNLCDASGCNMTRIITDAQPGPGSTIDDARMQAPRSLWDPDYVETSWITATNIPDCGSANGICGIALIPRLREHIAAHYPGTKISFTEYQYGADGYISGGVALADVLGIFGREGVFAATMWWGNDWQYGSCPTGNVDDCAYSCALPAFSAYLNYDGGGSHFGDTSIASTVSDPVRTATEERATVYGSVDASDPNRVVVVAINKTTSPLNAGVALTHTTLLTRAEIYTVTPASGADQVGCTQPTRGSDVQVTLKNAFNVTLPPTSITTIVMLP